MTQKLVKQHVVIVPHFDNPDDVGTVGIGVEMLQMFVSIGDGLRNSRNPIAVMCRSGEEAGILGNFTLKPEPLYAASRLEIWDDMADAVSLVPKAWMNRAGSLREGAFIFMYLEHAKVIGLPASQLVPGVHPVSLKVTQTARVSGRLAIPGIPADLPVLAKNGGEADFDPCAETVKEDPELQAARDELLRSAEKKQAGVAIEEESHIEVPKPQSRRFLLALFIIVLLGFAIAGTHLLQ